VCNAGRVGRILIQPFGMRPGSKGFRSEVGQDVQVPGGSDALIWQETKQLTAARELTLQRLRQGSTLSTNRPYDTPACRLNHSWSVGSRGAARAAATHPNTSMVW
jgi:hypothetical protein